MGGPSWLGGEVLIDTNLLLLLVLGEVEPAAIGKAPRLGQFQAEDWQALDGFLRVADLRVITTPHILTEVSNLAAQALGGVQRERFFDRFAGFAARIEEIFAEGRLVAALPRFSSFGLTDLGILHVAGARRALVLTPDGRLADYLGRNGVEAFGLERIRG